jgi:hypothetical protein
MVAIASLPATATAPGRAQRAGSPAPRPGLGPRRPALTLVPPHGSPSGSVAGRSVGGVLAMALLALAVVLAAGYLVLTPTVAPGSATAGTHVVAEGDTMWSIAVEHAPAGEAAGYVERLVAANGGASVAPGQELLLPAR